MKRIGRYSLLSVHKRALSEALGMIGRHRVLFLLEWLLSTGALFLPWALMLFVTPAQQWTQAQASHGVYLFFDSVASSEVETISQELESRLPIERVLYHDEAMVWSDMLSNLNLSEGDLKEEEGVLPTYLSLQFKRPLTSGDYTILSEIKTAHPKITKVLYDKDYNAQLSRVLKWLKRLLWGLLCGGILTFTLIALLSTQFLMARHHREILLQHLLGASQSFIALRFRYHLLLFALLSLGAAYGLRLGLVWALRKQFWFELGAVLKDSPEQNLWMASMALSCVVIAYVMAAWAVWRYCQKFERESLLRV